MELNNWTNNFSWSFPLSPYTIYMLTMSPRVPPFLFNFSYPFLINFLLSPSSLNAETFYLIFLIKGTCVWSINYLMKKDSQNKITLIKYSLTLRKWCFLKVSECNPCVVHWLIRSKSEETVFPYRVKAKERGRVVQMKMQWEDKVGMKWQSLCSDGRAQHPTLMTGCFEEEAYTDSKITL